MTYSGAAISMRNPSITRNEGDSVEVCARLDGPAEGLQRSITISLMSTADGSTSVP